MESVRPDTLATAVTSGRTTSMSSRVFPADRTAPRAAAAWFRGSPSGLSEERAADAELCLDELVTNVVRYAWEDPTGHEIRVEVERGQEALAITVEDDGRPFDPREAPLPAMPRSLDEAIPGGRGLMLVRSIAPRVDYERRDGRNRVTIAFPLAR